MRVWNFIPALFFCRRCDIAERKGYDMNKKSGITTSLKHYLEAVYTLHCEKGYVRTTDIAKLLCISKPSVNRAINSLKEHGYVEHEPYGDIYLTEKGCACAREAYNRHSMVKQFLIKTLEIDEKTAEQETEAIEHYISQLAVEKMGKYVQNAV